LEDNGARTHPARDEYKSKTGATIFRKQDQAVICAESTDLAGKASTRRRDGM